jgi:hypothetical protein
MNWGLLGLFFIGMGTGFFVSSLIMLGADVIRYGAENCFEQPKHPPTGPTGYAGPSQEWLRGYRKDDNIL